MRDSRLNNMVYGAPFPEKRTHLSQELIDSIKESSKKRRANLKRSIARRFNDLLKFKPSN